jgi:hypothetical protein
MPKADARFEPIFMGKVDGRELRVESRVFWTRDISEFDDVRSDYDIVGPTTWKPSARLSTLNSQLSTFPTELLRDFEM